MIMSKYERVCSSLSLDVATARNVTEQMRLESVTRCSSPRLDRSGNVDRSGTLIAREIWIAQETQIA